jgi:cellulose synthase/poly-beta-1,6-N-acetylglucosamine synthase-like glycosyltransferase
MLIDLVSALLLFFYVILIVVYLYGWLRIPDHSKMPEVDIASDFVYSIVIAARNEENTIKSCLLSIVHQQFSKSKFEVIVIDDHSSDNTAKQVLDFIAHHPEDSITLIRLQDLDEPIQNKKQAITYAISQCKGTHIVLTDADCTRGIKWLKSINQFVSIRKPVFIYGPVEFTATSVFEKIQAMEFAGLVGIGASAIQLGYPNMCSASNLIFSKEVFEEVGGYKGNDHIASGDDEFLLHRIYKRYPNQVCFLKNRDAVVYTSANTSIMQLAEQRRRWVSKSTKYENRYITAILVAAYLFNLLIFINAIIHPQLALAMLGVKMLTEGLFLYAVLSYFSLANYLWFLPIAECFHIFYVIVIGVWGNFSSYTWKGRKHT